MKRSHLVLVFLSVLFIFNIVQSGMMSLSHDEAYYWIYSLFPSWGYYDHPPMVAWLISLGTFFGKSEFALRFPFAVLQMSTLWLLWDLAERKNSLVFTLSVLSMPLIIGSGFLALPDTPLLFFSTLFWWLAIKYERNERPWHIVALGLTIACMFYSKYHSLVVVILTTMAMPQLLKRKSFWAIVGLVVVLYLPHIFWQLDNDFVTFDFHLNKRSEKHFDIKNILDFLGGQAALGGLMAFVYGLYKVVKTRLAGKKSLLFNSLGFFLFVFLLSFRNKIEANWTVTAFASLIPLLCLSINTKRDKIIFTTLSSASVIALFVFRISMMLDSNFEFMPKRLSEVRGWDKKTEKIVSVSNGGRIVADTYQMASKLSFYTDQIVPSLALGSRESQFKLLNLEENIARNEMVSYVSDESFPGSIKVEVGYGGPLYVLPLLPFEELLKMYNTTYEETVRN
ncbi:MAG: hypothetical protein CME64_14965 [Halobacteriovoraceae bacterium]|nr:hypothetical protein [Halobacteriovoraceae bacterium]|tara:strand:+ start:37960 stop:39315 length:1356 start_codon:yes stop_codon:yes gene_type:complete